MTLISKDCLDQWESEGNALRARIAELEARLTLAEKVCEAAAVYDRLGEDWKPVIDALAAWREGK